MTAPPSHLVDGPFSSTDGTLNIFLDGHAGLDDREWNALIGIVTAIIGNILISLALNIQRYAHIRLGRDKGRREKLQDGGKGKNNGSVDYSTVQARIAAERADLNLHSTADNDHIHTTPTKSYQRLDIEDDSASSGQSVLSQSSSDSTIRQEKSREERTQNTSYLKSPYWWAGILLMTVGEAGNFLAYGFAPASIVSPLGVVAIISNCIIAPWLLKEPFRKRDFVGVVVAIGGAVTVALSAKNSETRMGPHDIWKAITRWEFEVYLGITAGLMVILMWASGKYGDRTILIDLGLVALFGGYTALSTKGVASLLSDTLWRTLTFPISYLLVFILVATALLQIRYINRALQRFNSTQVIPTQFVLFTLSVIIGSAILYRDFESATVDRVLKFVGGCAMTFLGVYLITSGHRLGEDGMEEDNEEDEEEQPIVLLDEEAPYADESVTEDDKASKRQSQASITFYDGATRLKDSRRPSRQYSNGQQSLPHTPRRFNSSASSNLSPMTTPAQDPQLLENPWSSSQDRLAPRNSIQSTMSTPLMPSEGRPSTSRQHTHQHLETPQAPRPSTLTRSSITRILPALSSPLSSSLSAVVADNLRRGFDSPSRPKHRRGLSGPRRFESHGASEAADEETGLLPYSTQKGAPPGVDLGDTSRSKGRSQSLSSPFKGFFKLQRGKSRTDLASNEAGNNDHFGE